MGKIFYFLAVVILILTVGGQAQTKKIYVNVAEENLRDSPKGTKLGTLVNGAEMMVLYESDNWVKVQVTGWIWKPSTTDTRKSTLSSGYRALHILVKTREEADQAMKDLNAGQDFKQVATQKSISPSAASGGDLGYFRKGDFSAVIENAILELKVGQISGIIETPNGFNIFKRLE